MCAPVITEWNPIALADLSSDQLAASEDQEMRIKQVNRIIARWLPSCSSLALWVGDIDRLDNLVERLNKSFQNLLTAMELEDAEDAASELEVELRVNELHSTAIQFDHFLRRQAVAA